MPVYDNQCTICSMVFETFAGTDEEIQPCPKCGKDAKRIISVSGPNCFNENNDWIRSVTDVVEKDSGKSHCEEFLKNPTRTNYKNWMKGEGLRPMDSGEEFAKKPVAPDMTKVNKEVWEKFRQDHRLEVR